MITEALKSSKFTPNLNPDLSLFLCYLPLEINDLMSLGNKEFTTRGRSVRKRDVVSLMKFKCFGYSSPFVLDNLSMFCNYIVKAIL